VRAKSLLLLSFALMTLFGVTTPALAIGEDEYLPPEQAFTYQASANPAEVTVEWKATPGYYLYKKRMGLAAATAGVTVGESVYPKAEIHKDDYFGEQEVFRGNFKVSAPLTGAKPGDTVALKLKWQGCADAGLCYPPTVWDAKVTVTAAAAAKPASTADKVFDRVSAAESGDDEFLDPDVAFVLTTEALSTNTGELNWRIADGYYLYKERIKFEPADVAHPVGALVLPKGEAHHDEYFGDQEVFRGSLDGTFSVPPGAKTVDVKVTYQGRADAGLCYPPITKTLSVSLEGAPATVASTSPGSPADAYESEQDNLANKIKNGNLAFVVLAFFALGLGLSFTPCVLPMMPILSAMIARGVVAKGGENQTRRAFMMSVSYVLGMAVTYTGAGIAAGAIGDGFNLQATFNQPWIIVVFGLLFVVLALSMFGLFTIQMPSFVQTRLSDSSNRQAGDSHISVAIIGALSALIVSACVAPPLIAALTVISQTGSVLRGGSALFAMSIGMGTPLLILGASAGKFLPKAGAWMDTVKRFFGLMLLGVAVWMFSRIVSGPLLLLIVAVQAFVAVWVWWVATSKPSVARWITRAISVVLGVWGVALVAGAAMGGANPFAPIPQLAGEQNNLEFKRIKTVADLEREVAAAKAGGRSVMLDFYADWCVSCKEMEHNTFTEADVQAALANTTLLQADVTANDNDDQALLKHFGIFGPPTIAFYGTDGEEKRNFRVVGFMKAAEFAAVVRQAVAPATSPTT